MQLNEGTLIRLFTEDFCTAQKSLDHYYETPGSFREFMEATITGRTGQWVVPLNSAEVDADGQLTWEKTTRQAASVLNADEKREWVFLEHVSLSEDWEYQEVDLIITELYLEDEPVAKVAIEVVRADDQWSYKAYRTLKRGRDWINLEEVLWWDKKFQDTDPREYLIGSLEREIEAIQKRIQVVRDFKHDEL